MSGLNVGVEEQLIEFKYESYHYNHSTVVYIAATIINVLIFYIIWVGYNDSRFPFWSSKQAVWILLGTQCFLVWKKFPLSLLSDTNQNVQEHYL